MIYNYILFAREFSLVLYLIQQQSPPSSVSGHTKSSLLIIPIMILMLQCVRSELLKWQLQRLNLISKLCIKLPVAKGISLSYNTLARSLYVFGNLIHLLTAPKRQLFASWDLPRKPKNLRPCAVHFGVLHKVFFSSYFVLANHSATPAFLPFGTRADPEKISIFLWANSNSPPLYYRFTPSKRAGNPRIFLFEIPTGKG